MSLTKKRLRAPLLTGHDESDLRSVLKSLIDHFDGLEAKGALQITEASVNTTPVGDSDPSTGAFTTLSASGLISANGGQIKFPATQNASADANTLDDYAEGTWTPTVTVSSGAFTTVSSSGRYTKIGRLVLWKAHVLITTNGTAAGVITITLPFTAAQTHVGYGRETNVAGAQLQTIGTATTNTANILRYDNTYAGGNGYALEVQGHFEA